MKNSFKKIDTYKWHIAILNIVIFLLIMASMYGKGLQYLDFSIAFVTIYIIYVLIVSIFINKLKYKILFNYLCLAPLLFYTLIDFIDVVMSGNVVKPYFSYPDILTDFYFYTYFPILGSLISKWIGEIIHSQKTKKK